MKNNISKLSALTLACTIAFSGMWLFMQVMERKLRLNLLRLESQITGMCNIIQFWQSEGCCRNKY